MSTSFVPSGRTVVRLGVRRTIEVSGQETKWISTGNFEDRHGCRPPTSRGYKRVHGVRMGYIRSRSAEVGDPQRVGPADDPPRLAWRGQPPDGADAGIPLAYRETVLADQPLVYLRLDDGESVAVDSSGNGRHGSYTGGVTPVATGALAEMNGAALFDGVDGVVVVPDDGALRLDGDFTIEVWARLAEFVLQDPTLPELHKPLDVILGQGPLAERIRRACGAAPDRAKLRDVYERLSGCVESAESFRA